MKDTQDTVPETEAGPSSQAVSPPECMHTDVPSAADQARRRLLPKRSFLAGLLPARRHSKARSQDGQYTQVASPDLRREDRPSDIPPDVQQLVYLEDGALSDVVLEENYGKDVYRWAVLYENQRGLTFLSTPYYSPLSLLPVDPPPFTIPSASRSPRAGQPTVSIASYPLPDGTWRWVSRSWMVDMRGDGQTQYDGFEYNWFFRGKHWRSEVGHLSSGGWVRRRRWVRLMMRPAQAIVAPGTGQLPADNTPQHADEAATRPPSVISTVDISIDGGDVWEGDEDEDWARCRIALRKVGRDGRKLELWKMWLGRTSPITLSPGPSTPNTEINLTGDLISPSHRVVGEDVSFIAAPAPRERLASILREHGLEILQSFVYPDSRAQFVDLIARTGLLSDLETASGGLGSLAMLDFWSYASSLEELSRMDDVPP